MRGKYILIVLSIVAAMAAVAVVVWAGDPDNPPGPPETTFSYTLEDVYNRLDTGTAGTPITFTEPSSGPPTGTMHTLDEIYDLIGERAFVPKTGQTISYAVGDDGDLEMGVEWPSPRLITGTTGIVTDTLTGLIWLENANCFGQQTWATAVVSATALKSGECGLSDSSGAGEWRLPNVRELQSLMDYGQYNPALPSGHPFAGVQWNFYWSSTDYAGISVGYAWAVYLYSGHVDAEPKANPHYVWPVRGGQ